jgi:hypothetical protein
MNFGFLFPCSFYSFFILTVCIGALRGRRPRFNSKTILLLNGICGQKPGRPGPVKIGTVVEPAPVTGLAANFSPMHFIAPPPLGRFMTREEKALFAELDCLASPSFL